MIMRKKKARITTMFASLLLAFVMVISLLPVIAADTYAEVITITDGVLNYTVLDEDAKTVAVAGFTADVTGDQDVTVPASVQGYTVTEIGKDSFKWDTNIIGVSIPSGVTLIREGAFYNCTNLANLSIGTNSNLQSIGQEAFSYTKIPSVDIPSGVESIGARAFSECSLLTTVTFQENSRLEELNSGVFRSCVKLENISLPTGVTEIPDTCFSGCTALTSLPFDSGTAVSSFGEYAFRKCTSLTNVVLPTTLTSIGKDAFNECTGLTSITFPAALTSIGKSAFGACNNLTEVLMPEESSMGVAIGEDAFKNCGKLANAAVIAYATQIGPGAFYGAKIASAQMCEGLTGISDNAFRGCAELTDVAIPSTVRTIGDSAFEFCEKLEGVIIPEGVQTIGNSAFYNCDGLTSIEIPSTVTSIGNFPTPFANCDNLVEMTVAAGNSIYDSRNNCNAIIRTADNVLVSGCKATIIPTSVEQLGGRSFYYLHDLTEVKFADLQHSNLFLIDDACFNSCDGLVKCELPAGVKKIGQQAFDYCSSLKTLILPDGITEMNACFSGCSSLKELRLPYGLTYLTGYLLNGCSNLSLKIPSSVREIGQNALSGATLFNYQGTSEDWEKISINDLNPSFTSENLKFIDGDINIESTDINLTKTEYAYTGSSIEPSLILSYRDISLVRDRDYEINCTNNVNAGTATATITGKGSFIGSATVTYKITGDSSGGSGGGSGDSSGGNGGSSDSSGGSGGNGGTTAKAISKATIASIADKTYTGKALAPAVTVKDGSTTLKSGTDYTVSYKNNTNVGTATVTVTGKGKYTGTKTATFKIVAASISKADISGISAKTYTGSAITQTPVVKLGSKTLKNGTDYTVSYSANTNVGTAKVTVKGKGNYTGSVAKTFKIDQAANPLTAKAKAPAVKYKKLKKKNQTIATKKAVTVKNAQGTVTYKKAKGSKKIKVDPKTGKITVKKGLKKGTYAVKIKVSAKGNENYKKGSKTVTVKIKVK